MHGASCPKPLSRRSGYASKSEAKRTFWPWSASPWRPRPRRCCTVFRPRASWSCDPMRPRSPGPWTSCAGWNGEAMQLEVIQRKENPLLKRTEVSYKAIHKAEAPKPEAKPEAKAEPKPEKPAAKEEKKPAKEEKKPAEKKEAPKEEKKAEPKKKGGK